MMGCNQSSPPMTISNNTNVPSYSEKWSTNNFNHGVERNGGVVNSGEIDQPPPEFREELFKSYQAVLDSHLSNMTKAIGPIGDSKAMDALLQEYKECEKRIRSFEKEDPLILYYVKQSRLKSIEEVIKSHSEMTDNMRKQIMEDLNKEVKNGGAPASSRTLRSALIKAGDAAKLPKAEQEMIAKQNSLEIAITEMEMLFQEKAILESDIQELKTVCANLTSDYKRQEDIASQLSINSTGRGEMALLDELANVETRRIKISEVYERWKEARIQVADSCRQFSSALEKWREMKDDSIDNQYDMAEEVRDELITALQFLGNAKFYVQHEFPYCTKQEMTILTKALTYIFVDMRTEERRRHADSCYAAFHNRAVALYAWVDTTLKAIIQPVVLQTADDLRSIMGELQELRFQNIKIQHSNTSEEPSQEKGRYISNVDQLDDKMSVELLQHLDLSQLAPLPRTVDLFGKPTEDLVESYKTTLRESMAKQHDTKLTIENNLDGLVQKRKESLVEKDLVQEETVGLA